MLERSVMRRVMLLGALVIIADALDIISTYLATPDLALEWNPLVRSFGWGWGAIILLHVIIDAIFLCWLWFYWKSRPDPSTVPEDVDTTGKRAVWFITGYHSKGRTMDMKRYLGFLGLVIPLGAAVNALCNAVLNFSFYAGWFGGLNEGSYVIFNLMKLIIIIILIIFFVYLILKNKYKNKNIT